MTFKNRHLYKKTLIKNCHFDRWSLTSIKTGTPETQRAKLKGTLDFFNRLDLLEKIEQDIIKSPNESDLSQNINKLAEQLKEDLCDYLSDEENDKFKITELLFLPLPTADGYCINSDFSGNLLDGYIVCINEGIWLCSQLLGKSFVLENMQGDFIGFKKSGKLTFDIAVSHFIGPNSKNANSIFFEDVPPDVEGAASAAQSSMAILILQFITLHEIGHIIKNHFLLMKEYSFHIIQSNSSEDIKDSAWDAEYEADLFALNAICNHSGNIISKWANFITVWILFEWLQTIEDTLKKPICSLHPTPKLRLEKLQAWMYNAYPPTENISEYIDATRAILKSWKGS